MGLQVKSQGEWKELRSINTKVDGEWRPVQYVYTCNTSNMDGVVRAFDLPNRTLLLDMDSDFYTFTINRPVSVLKKDGTYFTGLAGLAETGDTEYPAVFWEDGADNAPTSSTDFTDSPGAGEVATVITQWQLALANSVDIYGQQDLTAVMTSTGGDELTYADSSGENTCVLFDTPGTHTFTVVTPGFCDIVLVGGGGGGGKARHNGTGGGGGGGQVVLVRKHWLDAGDYEVVVGDGGTGGLDTRLSDGEDIEPTSGGSSTFSVYTALGGGAGGLGVGNISAGVPALNQNWRTSAGVAGGCGGGGGAKDASTSGSAPGGNTVDRGRPAGTNHLSMIVFENEGNPGGIAAAVPGDYDITANGGDGGSAWLPDTYELGSNIIDGPLTDAALREEASALTFEGVLFSESRGFYVPGDGFDAVVFGRGGSGLPSATPADGADGQGEGGQASHTDAQFGELASTYQGGDGGSGIVYIAYSNSPATGVTIEESRDTTDPIVVLPTAGVGTGGVESAPFAVGSENWITHTFDANGTFVVTEPGVFDIFVIGAGGGAGGYGPNNYLLYGSGGAGGAGALVLLRSMQLYPGSYDIRVGTGGLGTSMPGIPAYYDGIFDQYKERYEELLASSFYDSTNFYPSMPTSGGDSSFGVDMIVCKGGGHGGVDVYKKTDTFIPGIATNIQPEPGGCGGAPALLNYYQTRSLSQAQAPGGSLAPVYPASGHSGVFAGFSSAPAITEVLGPYQALYPGGESAYALQASELSGTWVDTLLSTYPLIGTGSNVIDTGVTYDPTLEWSDLRDLQAIGAGGGPISGRPYLGAFEFDRGFKYILVTAPGGNGLVVVARRDES